MRERRRFIVLPNYGYRFRDNPYGPLVAATLQAGRNHMVARRPNDSEKEVVRVIEQIGADGPFLIETTSAGELALKSEFTTYARVLPVQYYRNPDPRRVFGSRTDNAEATGPDDSAEAVRLLVADTDTAHPVPDVELHVFTNYRHREGVAARTGADGIAWIGLKPGTRIERLYAYPRQGYWSRVWTGLDLSAGTLSLEAIRANDPRHVVPRLYGTLPIEAGQAVTVGIIDTGIDRTHPSLRIAGGRNCVFEELAEDQQSAGDYDDVDQHGTHVAGIVGARGPIRGVAPGASIRAYRVFPANGGDANTFDIMRAVELAVADRCDVINLSLGGPLADDAVRGAIGDAIGAGVLVVAAAGNDGRRPVSFPAAYDPVVAVSAIGIRGTYPATGAERFDAARPASLRWPHVYLAGFSNTGPQIDVAAPGVGIVSTVPGGAFAVMSGTSMAAPVVTGLAAALLSADPNLLALQGEARTSGLLQAIIARTVNLGLDRDSEGHGLPGTDPAVLQQTLDALA